MEKKYEINKIEIPVVIIKRTIHKGNSPNASTPQMTTILTRFGYILNHSWGDTVSNKMVIKKSMRVVRNGHVENDPMVYLKNNWNQDVRLKSIYLDKVVSTTYKQSQN